MVRTKKVSGIAIGVLLIVAILVALLPKQQASAIDGYWYGVDAPHRGSGLARCYVYSTTWQTCTELFCWMEVRANTWRYFDGSWHFRKSAVKGGDWVNTVSCTAKSYESALDSDPFKNVGQIQYDYDGYHYTGWWETGGPVTL